MPGTKRAHPGASASPKISEMNEIDPDTLRDMLGLDEAYRPIGSSRKYKMNDGAIRARKWEAEKPYKELLDAFAASQEVDPATLGYDEYWRPIGSTHPWSITENAIRHRKRLALMTVKELEAFKAERTAKSAKYYDENKTELLEHSTEYYEEHGEEKKARMRERYASDPEYRAKKLASKAKWREENEFLARWANEQRAAERGEDSPEQMLAKLFDEHGILYLNNKYLRGHFEGTEKKSIRPDFQHLTDDEAPLLITENE